MKKTVLTFGICVLSFLLFGAAFVAPLVNANSEKTQVMVTIINAKGEKIGTAMITEIAGIVRLHIEAKNLPPGLHGIHFHETGKCDTPDFKTAGEHLNPHMKQHGFYNPNGFHAGDLPNIQVEQDGTVTANLESKVVTLTKGVSHSMLKPGGTALMIHEKADDYFTDPSGNSGNRIACGPIQ
jgi:Cu-Zn family superoxide dismutase